MQRDHERPKVALLVTDLDNTLYDWFAMWHASFASMLDSVSKQSGVPKATLEEEIRQVHQKRGTSEYSYLLNELPSLKALHPGQDLAVVFKEAVIRFQTARRKSLRLYPSVLQTLHNIKQAGVPIIAYTESLAYYAIVRIKRLGLDGVIDVLYSPPDHEFPEGISPEKLRSRRSEHYRLERTTHRTTPQGILKPDATVLTTILEEVDAGPEQTVYVGDSLMKDVAMAQSVGVIDVLAKYGLVQDRHEYDLLRRVSHWSKADVERERQIATRGSVEPSYVLNREFGEILQHFRFGGVDG